MKYCYEDSNVLINKFDIRDNYALTLKERDITSLKLMEIKADIPFEKTFDENHFKAIHKYLFEDIYSWAGEFREVTIGKENSWFAPHEYLETSSQTVFNDIKKDNYLQGIDNKDIFIDRLAYHMTEVNFLHPFREGNGRTQKLFFEQLAENAGYELDFSLADKYEQMEVDKIAFKGNLEPLKEFLDKITNPFIIVQKKSLEEKIDSMKEKSKETISDNKDISKDKEMER